MGDEMMERVEQLEEKVKRLEGELVKRSKIESKYRSGVRRRIIILIFGAVVVGPIIAFILVIINWFVEK